MKKSAENYIYKIADTEEEFEQIHRLNYETFCEEIPQHEKNEARRLVDKFHTYNTYFIAKKGGEIICMFSVCGRRPFSVEQKVAGFDSYFTPGKRLCEFRLFAAKKGYRGLAILRGFSSLLNNHIRKNGFEVIVASGTLRQTTLYRHMGFEPFGPLVGTQEAPYQPMYLSTEDISSPLIQLMKKDELKPSF